MSILLLPAAGAGDASWKAEASRGACSWVRAAEQSVAPAATQDCLTVSMVLAPQPSVLAEMVTWMVLSLSEPFVFILKLTDV